MMFAYLKGILTKIQPTYVIVEVQGIGYFLSIPGRLLGELPPLGHTVHFYTTFVVRELSQTLYGFLCSQERDAFELLMNVSGIGPKLALNLIGHLSYQELQGAVVHQDIPALCRAPGVDKKTAERLIVELKDRLSALLPVEGIASLRLPGSSPQLHDAAKALMNLGYPQGEAQKAVLQSLKELEESPDLALLITTALKKIG